MDVAFFLPFGEVKQWLFIYQPDHNNKRILILGEKERLLGM